MCQIPGTGKTALAVHWAHQVASRFPDGQLYVNLRGYDPGQPMPPADALAAFLRALGVPGHDIPADTGERAARYRSLLAGRRMLVLLDNAGSAEQVRPLLPACPACLTLVTSRDTLAGLVARDGARRLDLDLLAPADAAGLLTTLIGDRAAADPAATAALATACARLPLALRVAAELAAARDATALAGLVDELADEQWRLDVLDAGGDPRTAVRAVFSWSYRHLDAGSARAFRLAGLHPGHDFDRYAVAALTGSTVGQADDLTDRLARAHLIHSTGPGRHGMHDLLRAYARELSTNMEGASTEGASTEGASTEGASTEGASTEGASTEGASTEGGVEAGGGQDEQRAALTRLFDFYLHTAAAAMDTLFPAERHRRPRIPRPATPDPPVTEAAQARAWLDSERASLIAIAAHTAAHGWPGHTTRLAATLYRYLDTGSHFPEAIIIHGHARLAAQHTGDKADEATALTNLGIVDWQQCRYQQATGLFQQALTLFRETGNRTGEARALHSLGMAELAQDRYQPATGLFQQALTLFRETGDRTGEARALHSLGRVEQRQGHYEQATDLHQQALALFRETGDQPSEAMTLARLGVVDLRLGRYQQAADHQRQALVLYRETGDRASEADAFSGLGDLDLRQGRYQQAASHYQMALALYREFGVRVGEAEALNGLGEVLLATGRPADARTQHTAALGLASQIGHPYNQARAHNGLGHAWHALGDAGQARSHWQEALARYTKLGAPEAAEVQARLAAPTGSEQAE